MTWFKVDDTSAFNAKVLAAGNEAWGAFCRVGAWCAQQLSDGRFSRAIAVTIAPWRVWERLQQVGLVDPLQNGEMQVHDYLQRNPSKEQVLRERAATRARVSGIRNGRRNGVGTPVHSPGVTGLPSRPVPTQPDPEGDARASGVVRHLTPVTPPPEPSEAVPPPREPEGRESPTRPTGAASGDSERPVELAERIWHELWEAKYRRPYEHTGKYAFGPQSEDQVLVRIAEKASIRGPGAEPYLRHKIGAYLKDHGNRGWLDEHCHPLRCLEHDWVAYGEPKEPKRMVPRREERVDELLSIDEMAARAAAAMTLKIGNGGT